MRTIVGLLPLFMRMTCEEKILSEEYGELIVDFTGALPSLDGFNEYCFTRINERYGIGYVRQSELDPIMGTMYIYHYLPRIFGLMADDFDPVSLINSGILQTQRPPLSLNGSGVVVAFIDTGIRFAQEEFLNEAGNSRILAIWDQTIQTGNAPEGFRYGTLFSREDINEALRAENPYEVLPSYDEIGHGTAMASVAAGSVVDGGRSFRGAAPGAEIVVVKLRQAKQNLRDYYMTPEGVPAFSEADIMLGVKFAESFAVTFRRPVVICIGLGSNQGDHNIGSSLAQYLNSLSTIRNRGIVICGGNEGDAAHHYSGFVPYGQDAHTDVEIRVGEGEKGFILELWGCVPDVFCASIRTPGGETIQRFRPGMGQSLTYSFVYEQARVTIDSLLVEPTTGDELIAFRFQEPTAGIWRISVYASQDGGRRGFHMWLPITQFMHSDTYFLDPSPYVTLTDPGIAVNPITVSTYNDFNNSFYANSGRGFLRNGTIKPDFAAPGVEVSTSLGKRTGSSIAAALTAGSVAQFFQWTVVKNNDPLAQNEEIKTYFIRGAVREPGLVYPNQEWGYGRLNVAEAFDSLAGV